MKRLILTTSVFLSALMGSAQTVTHQACEQSIITPKADGRYLWLPIQDSAHEGRVQVIVGNEQMMIQNVRMAREKVDYYLPLDLQPWLGKKGLNVVVQDVPFGSVCFKNIAQNSDADYKLIDEKFRPEFHHTPKRGWMNDPNGMFYKDGVWHLYYQYNPYGSMWGNMHWAHSTSTDLINWTAQPIALAPDAWGTMFSGSCVVDHDNTAGFGKDAVIAMYTTSRQTPFGGDVQAQCLAYSLDNGQTFTKYEGNPVLTGDNKDFRDPNPFWNEEIKAWNLILACGQEMRIYSSPNLKDWKEESRFGEGLGCHDGVWECPDLFKLPVVGKWKVEELDGPKEKVKMENGKWKVESSKTAQEKWVLFCNINPGGPAGGSATQYFIGDFDGHKFTVDDESRYKTNSQHPSPNTQHPGLWQDYGKDHYATVSFYNAPNGRHPMIAWMSNWQYANDVPTKQYRSSNSISREPFLYYGKDYTNPPLSPKGCLPEQEHPSPNTLFLGSAPSPEYDGKGLDTTVKIKGSCTVTLCNDEGEEYKLVYDEKAMTLTADRSKSGETSFSKDFSVPTTAPVHNKLTSLRIFIDRSSVEVFGNNGEVCITNLVFPKNKYTKVTVTR